MAESFPQDVNGSRSLLWLWMAIALLALVADFLTGFHVQFPILFLVPVTAAAWYNGRGWAFTFAIGLPLVRGFYHVLWEAPWTILETLINGAIRMIVLGSFAFLVDRTAKQTRLLSHEVRVLTGLLPICCICKKIRTRENAWEPLEQYIEEHSEAEFTHGLCPDCLREHYGEYDVSRDEGA